jgi:enolase
MPKIKSITCHKVIDSRAEWTIETHVKLDDGSFGIQTIPEGASKGENEAVSLPADKAVSIVSTAINDALHEEDALDQSKIDQMLIDIDGTDNKRHLGANSTLSVSLALAKACAMSEKLELWEYIALLYRGKKLAHKNLHYPTPVFNIINGGKHAHNNLSFQEFMVIPSKNLAIDKALEVGITIYHTLKDDLIAKNFDVDVGDEGGFAPNNLTVEQALSLIRQAASKSFKPGEDVFFGMDVAAESFYKLGEYTIPEESKKLNTEQLANYYTQLLKKFELIYIEDPFYERDLLGWQNFNSSVGNKLMVVADDLVVTNAKYLQGALDEKLANAVIVKPNQIGTLTETLNFVKIAQQAKLSIIVSHRSGDTAEDTFIADLGIAVGADFMKAGAPVRGERVAKYNRLLEIYSGES